MNLSVLFFSVFSAILTIFIFLHKILLPQKYDLSIFDNINNNIFNKNNICLQSLTDLNSNFLYKRHFIHNDYINLLPCVLDLNYSFDSDFHIILIGSSSSVGIHITKMLRESKTEFVEVRNRVHFNMLRDPIWEIFDQIQKDILIFDFQHIYDDYATKKLNAYAKKRKIPIVRLVSKFLNDNYSYQIQIPIVFGPNYQRISDCVNSFYYDCFINQTSKVYNCPNSNNYVFAYDVAQYLIQIINQYREKELLPIHETPNLPQYSTQEILSYISKKYPQCKYNHTEDGLKDDPSNRQESKPDNKLENRQQNVPENKPDNEQGNRQENIQASKQESKPDNKQENIQENKLENRSGTKSRNKQEKKLINSGKNIHHGNNQIPNNQQHKASLDLNQHIINQQLPEPQKLNPQPFNGTKQSNDNFQKNDPQQIQPFNTSNNNNDKFLDTIKPSLLESNSDQAEKNLTKSLTISDSYFQSIIPDLSSPYVSHVTTISDLPRVVSYHQIIMNTIAQILPQFPLISVEFITVYTSSKDTNFSYLYDIPPALKKYHREVIIPGKILKEIKKRLKTKFFPEYVLRNLGARRAKGEYIIVGSSDVLMPPGFFISAEQRLFSPLTIMRSVRENVIPVEMPRVLKDFSKYFYSITYWAHTDIGLNQMKLSLLCDASGDFQGCHRFMWEVVHGYIENHLIYNVDSAFEFDICRLMTPILIRFFPAEKHLIHTKISVSTPHLHLLDLYNRFTCYNGWMSWHANHRPNWGHGTLDDVL